MKLLQIIVVLAYFSVGHSYTKYGRSCKDIGCPSNQQCVMQTDPCSYYHRQGECGSYPSCQRVSNSARTCATYVCPPTKVCKMDGDTPKCLDDASKVGHVGYDTQNQNSMTNHQHSVSSNNQGLYPQLSKKGTTTVRPNVYKPANSNSGGYQGQVGSGYPQQGAYPQGQYPGYTRTSGYPQQAYPQQAYPQQAYPQQAYPQQAYPQQTYPQQAYPQGNYPRQAYPQQANYPGQGYYPQQGAYPQYGNQRPAQYPGYTQPNQGTSITDKLTNSIKNLGTELLQQTIAKAIAGRAQ